jgi:hypothetical protein
MIPMNLVAPFLSSRKLAVCLCLVQVIPVILISVRSLWVKSRILRVFWCVLSLRQSIPLKLLNIFAGCSDGTNAIGCSFHVPFDKLLGSEACHATRELHVERHFAFTFYQYMESFTVAAYAEIWL